MKTPEIKALEQFLSKAYSVQFDATRAVKDVLVILSDRGYLAKPQMAGHSFQKLECLTHVDSVYFQSIWELNIYIVSRCTLYEGDKPSKQELWDKSKTGVWNYISFEVFHELCQRMLDNQHEPAEHKNSLLAALKKLEELNQSI